MLTEVHLTEEVGVWLEGLDRKARKAIAHYVRLLQARGVTLDYPYSSSINGARHRIRELRVSDGRREFRVFYAFAPDRSAVLLTGGNKVGVKRFYQQMTSEADRLYDEYVEE